MKKKIIVLGAGPAGLTTALELLRNNEQNEVFVLESDDRVGGLAKTIDWNGNRFDLGGHRYFTHDRRVIDWWNQMLYMPVVSRKSSIYYRGQFIEYPLKYSIKTLRVLGAGNVFKIIQSYLARKQDDKGSLEDFFVSRFGSELYQLFFHDYTCKVWGREPSQISSDWGPQRIEGVSLKKVLKTMFTNKCVEPSMTDNFYFSAQGCGALWDNVAAKIEQMGGIIMAHCKVEMINR